MTKNEMPESLPLYTVAEAIAAFDPARQRSCRIVAELGELRSARSGHTYGTLSDGTGTIPCVLWRRLRLPFTPTNGQLVEVQGHLQIGPNEKKLEVDVERCTLKEAHGPRALARQSLEERLAAEGLFDAGRKRALPVPIRSVTLITSSTGDALPDVQSVLARAGWPLRAQLVPVPVCGAPAASAIVRALETIGAGEPGDVVLLTRGGGTDAALDWANDEAVVRAVAACAVPVVSAVGHAATDTLIDRVADLRCATPSAAAALLLEHAAGPLDPQSVQDAGADGGLSLRLSWRSLTLTARFGRSR